MICGRQLCVSSLICHDHDNRYDTYTNTPHHPDEIAMDSSAHDDFKFDTLALRAGTLRSEFNEHSAARRKPRSALPMPKKVIPIRA